ncbi:hypothetical protein AAG747_17920 [Rapidithrix thailandica]|uniref:Uncharacterized protein n=1 Tax=Rapidithrix thailandica TaxID=413964 RepID=A0AAW9RY22_9BACT
MEVKGSVVKSIYNFVETQFPTQHKVWLNALPSTSADIYNDAILATQWYPIEEAVIRPTELLCQMFYQGSPRGAWEAGMYSAQEALTGVYKVFVMISTPAFLMNRAEKILSSFYAPSKVEVVESTAHTMSIHLTEWPYHNELLEYRIGGWMEKALEICGCRKLNVNISKSLVKGDEVTEFSLSWES